VVADAAAFVEAVATRPEVDAGRIVFHGRSLGGGVACALAERRAPVGLIVESTFTSVTSMAARYLVPPLLVRNPFRNDAFLRRFAGPVLIMHGSADGIVPVRHGRRLHEIAPGSVYAECVSGHNDFPPDWDWYEAHIRALLERAGAVAPVTPP
jgi:fermentation-respiration switch protein FrsA (DUF1100 family)